MFTPMFHGQNRNTILLPTVITLDIDALQAQDTPSLFLSLQIIDEPTYDIVEQGLYYSKTNNNPGIGDTKISQSFYVGSGIYNHVATGLDFSTLYYAKAFVKNSTGHITWGEVKSATTQTDRYIAELWHENIGRTNGDVGVIFTKSYMTPPESINQTKLWINAGSPPDTNLPPQYYLSQIYLSPDMCPYKHLAILPLGYLTPNTTYYYTVYLYGGDSAHHMTPEELGVRLFTTLP